MINRTKDYSADARNLLLIITALCIVATGVFYAAMYGFLLLWRWLWAAGVFPL